MGIFEYVSELFNVQKMWEKRVREDFRMLEDVQKMCEKRVREDFRVLKDVPKEYITQEMCENVFSEWSGSIYIIPEEYKTREMCLKAVKDDVRLSIWIPKRYYEDAEFIELRRCKGSKDGNDSCDDGIKSLKNCHECHKVVCYKHTIHCNECAASGMTMCKECSDEITTIVCEYHYDSD